MSITSAPPSISKLRRKKSTKQKLYHKSIDSAAELAQALKAKGQTIVLTQGVYDLIHEGHARYLEIAKSHGDVLIVGIDSDALTRQRKGKTRPIVPQKERIEMLLHLKHVDFVVLRDISSDIGDLIRAIKPDVLITSSSTQDFTDKMVKAYGPYCGAIVTLPPQSTTSTSARVRQLTIDGATSLAEEINRITKEFLEKIRGI